MNNQIIVGEGLKNAVKASITMNFTKKHMQSRALKFASYAASGIASVACPPLGIAMGVLSIGASVASQVKDYQAFKGKYKQYQKEDYDEKAANQKCAADYCDRNIALAQKKLAEEKDPDKKKELEEQLKAVTAMRYDKDGKERDLDKVAKEIKENIGEKEYNKLLKNTKKNIKDNAEKFSKEAAELSDEDVSKYKDEAKESAKKTHEAQDKEDQEAAEKVASKEEPKDDENKEEEEPKEETVTDETGVEWVKRKKERGDGFTYCRKDDREITMSEDEFKKQHKDSKSDKSKEPKESCEYTSLRDLLLEALDE